MTYKTIGATGDYPDIGSAINSLIGTLSDDYYFTCTSNHTNTTSILSPSNIIHNGYTVTFDLGNYTIINNVLIYYNHGNNTDSSGSIELKNGAIFINSTAAFVKLKTRGGSGGTSPLRRFITNLFISDHLLTGTSFISNVGALQLECLRDSPYNGWDRTRMVNCRFYMKRFQIAIATIKDQTGGSGSYSDTDPYCIYLENSSFYCKNANPANISYIFKSMTTSWGGRIKAVNAGGVGKWSINNYPINTAINCAEDGSTLVNGTYLTVYDCITGITNGDFTTVDPIDKNEFLKITITSAFFDAGSPGISSWNFEDFIQNPRPSISGVVSIGAHEPVLSAFTNNLIEKKGAIGFRHESTPYTPETLTASDYTYPINETIQIIPDVDKYAQVLSVGTYSKFPAIMGKRKCAINFSIDIYTKETLTEAPEYFDILRSCGWKQTTHASGVSIKPDALYNRVPATIEVAIECEGDEPRQLVYKITGAMGIAKIIGEIGFPVRIEFSFIGALEGITTRSYSDRITPVIAESIPIPLLSAGVLLYNDTIHLTKFDISSNESVLLFTDISKKAGYDGSRVIDRSVHGQLDADLGIDTIDKMYNRIQQNESGTFSIAYSNIQIASNHCQVVNYHPLELVFQDDDIELLQGSK